MLNRKPDASINFVPNKFAIFSPMAISSVEVVVWEGQAWFLSPSGLKEPLVLGLMPLCAHLFFDGAFDMPTPQHQHQLKLPDNNKHHF